MSTKTSGKLIDVPIGQIEPWPGLNPRTKFAKSELQELVASIKANGLLQPVGAAPAGEGAKKGVKYWLFAGERRLRAVWLARLKTIRTIVADVDEATAHRLAGTENLDRSNLTPIEEALWLERELELTPKLTQRKLASELKRSQPWIANRLRLLELPDSGRALIQDGVVAPATARDLLLPFVKLEEGVGAKVFTAIEAALQHVAGKNGEQVTLPDAREAIGNALAKAGGVQFESGYKYLKGTTIEIAPQAVAAFVQKHSDRCVRFESRRHPFGSPPYWTWARKEWKEIVDGLVKKSKKRDNRPYRPSPEKLKDPKLGPTKRPISWDTLGQRFGYDTVVELHLVPDLSKVEPERVTRAIRTGWQWNPETQKREGHKETVLAYVGADVRELRNQEHQLVREEEELLAAAAAARMLEVAERNVPETSIYRGLLGRLVRDPRVAADDLQYLVRAAGHELPEHWGLRWGSSPRPRIEDLKLDGFECRRLAAALAVWDSDGDREAEAEASLRAKAAERIKAWFAEHELTIPAGIEGVS